MAEEKQRTEKRKRSVTWRRGIHLARVSSRCRAYWITTVTLIQQVNSNHRSKIPDNLVKNVSLIREINGNISKVISIYSDLSVNFSNIVQERRRVKNGGESNLESTSNES
ncbi:hypothetical protein OIU77_016993 [Salix suchowensis]|uniref:Protein EARLY FLOWERING 4 domain-containing protein n=1 Tax=Salix suchowensis TaxID=1278906 RepID=A0ABQ8ZMS2_9ROSI|nr:hypothetical protein OIU77_016993 [Salix suchowensis]